MTIHNQPTVLVVEDEKPLLDAARLKLEKQDFVVLTARSVEEAKKHLQEVPNISAVWLDHYLLGRGTGLDFVSELKNHEQWKKIPVLVVSNTASSDKVQSYLQLGVTKYFTKSNYRLDQIIEELKQALNTHESA